MELLKEYGIESVEQLEQAIKRLKVDIGIFVGGGEER